MITVCIVGVDYWEKYTRPAIESIQKHEPDVSIIVIDSGSDPPYPDLPFVMRTKRTGYAEALNIALLRALGWEKFTSWLLFLNNDVLCTGPFVEQIMRLSNDRLYGIETNSHAQMGEWLNGAVLLVSTHIFGEIGGFDEKYEGAGFEDADYSRRVLDIEMKLETLPYLPFTHLHAMTRLEVSEDYEALKERNRQYYLEKFR